MTSAPNTGKASYRGQTWIQNLICIDDMVKHQFELMLFSKARKHVLKNAKEEIYFGCYFTHEKFPLYREVRVKPVSLTAKPKTDEILSTSSKTLARGVLIR